MATARIILDQRAHCKDGNGAYPLVVRIGHKSQNRDIPLDIHALPSQFNIETRKITGITNAVRHSKRVQKLYSDIDLWLDENKAIIKLWTISKLKQEIERLFFNKQNELTLLQHGAKYLQRLIAEERFPTASSYQDALKVFVKFQMKQQKQNDKVKIKTLFDKKGETFIILDEYLKYDTPIKAFDTEFAKDFKAYLARRLKSKNSLGIFLRSLQAIINDAGGSYVDLKDHRPLERIKKGSYQNTPNPLTLNEVSVIRRTPTVADSGEFHAKNYFLFMFGNMGANFVDLALMKRSRFDGERIKYFRKKTEEEGDFFSIKQNEECIAILDHYISEDQKPDDYLFPILPNGIAKAKIHRTKNDRLQTFNDQIRRLAKRAGITKDITSYTARDTWTNIGFEMGIDIRKISAGLGHSSIEVTNKHYGASIHERILDEINEKITASA